MKWNEVAQACPTLCNPMDCSLPGSSVHEIFQARIPEWVAISCSRGSSRPRDRTQVFRIAGRRSTIWATREALVSTVYIRQSPSPSSSHSPFPLATRLFVLYICLCFCFVNKIIYMNFSLFYSWNIPFHLTFLPSPRKKKFFLSFNVQISPLCWKLREWGQALSILWNTAERALVQAVMKTATLFLLGAGNTSDL